jgi:hypothetical protein
MPWLCRNPAVYAPIARNAACPSDAWPVKPVRIISADADVA